MELLLVITCLEGQLGINCPSAFLNEGNFKFSKIARVVYAKNFPDWLITQNQQTFCIEVNIF